MAVILIVPTATAFGPLGLGFVVVTEAAQAALMQEEMQVAITRHAAGEWGVCDEDKAENDRQAKRGGMVLSEHRAADGTLFWIITDPGHTVTTILLTSDY